jgi:hypothetical protein
MKFLKKKPSLTDMELEAIRKTVLEELQFKKDDLSDLESEAILDLLRNR